LPAGMAGNPQTEKSQYAWLWKVFGDVISVGSGQLVKVYNAGFLLRGKPLPVYLPASFNPLL